MKLSRFAACLLSLLTAAAFTTAAAVPAFAEGEAPGWSESDEIEPEDPEEPEPEEPEETEPQPEAPPEGDEPEDPEEDEPAAALDQDDPPATEATAAPPAPLPEVSYTPESEQTMYAPQVINIRSGPGTDYDKLGVLYANSEITVIGSSGEWAAVSYNGSTGYILRSLLSSTPPATTTAAAAPETPPPQNEEIPPAEELPPPETEPTESDWQTPEIAQPIETTAPPIVPTEESTTTRAPVPAANLESTDGGLPPFLLALLSAAAAFLLIGVLPVFIHRVHHKNLYRY